MNPHQQATLFIISAPSGAGKTSLVNALIRQTKDLVVSVSYTTRPKRSNEQEGIAYHFIDLDIFQKMKEQNIFLEFANVFGHYYGTSQQWVYDKLQKNIDVILEIDWQGAVQVKEKIPEAVSIFIIPPSLATLHERLCKRGQDDKAVIEKRLAEALFEIKHYDHFDYLVINDDFDLALNEIKSIITSERLRCNKMSQTRKQLIHQLLS